MNHPVAFDSLNDSKKCYLKVLRSHFYCRENISILQRNPEKKTLCSLRGFSSTRVASVSVAELCGCRSATFQPQDLFFALRHRRDPATQMFFSRRREHGVGFLLRTVETVRVGFVPRQVQMEIKKIKNIASHSLRLTSYRPLSLLLVVLLFSLY